jgi:hypothetical protein
VTGLAPSEWRRVSQPAVRLSYEPAARAARSDCRETRPW